MTKDKLIQELTEEKKKLTGVIREVEKRLRSAPDGSVRIAKHGAGVQFYLRTDGADTKGLYMPVSDRGKAIAIIQKKYDQKILTTARKQQKTISQFLKDYDPEALRKIYSSMSGTRKKYVISEDLPDEEYIREWLSFAYTHKPFAEDIPEHYTSAGERVRSKSEVLIADALQQAGVPYRYECPLELGKQKIHPDFTILRLEDRKELFWEHLGMMDDSDYFFNAMQRIRQYESYGIFPGIDLILTMESSGLPINMTVIRRMINAYCV